MDGKLAVVFGGSGFVGRSVVRELARRGARVTVGVRDVERAKFLKPMGAVGQVTPVRADVTNAGQIAKAVEGADIVISLVGILYQSGRNTFDAVQASGPGTIARIAASAGVGQLVHISSIGADPASPSHYSRSKAQGEAAVQAAFASATILRPSIIFGPDDTFFNRFASLATVAPFLPLIGGRTRMQPVYVQDIANAVMRVLDDPGTQGRLYELGGPKIYSFRELMDLMMAYTLRPRRLIDVPFPIADLKARFLELLPRPPLTRDQVRSLKVDNLCSDDCPGLAELGIEPTACEVILPTYLDRFRPGGRYNKSRISG